MSQLLISRSADLKQLRDEGYDIEIKQGHLLVKSVPYVNSKRDVRRGTLVVPLGDVTGDETRPPSEHTAYFTGEHPCCSDGSAIEGIRHSTQTQELAKGVTVNHRFSAKPKPDGRYRDYHHKMTAYVCLISAPTRSIDPTATAQTCAIVAPEEDESPFNYVDSASSRAGIGAVTAKLVGQKIAIIGVGGTGSYVLDLVAKTPVSEIHLYDGDAFSNHNAFRSPGAPSLQELRERPLKATYFKDRYSKMHRGVFAHVGYVDEANVTELRGMNFVFLCMDRGAEKRLIVDQLQGWELPFVDVGMGVDLGEEGLRGQVRVTVCTPKTRDHIGNRISFSEGDVENDYSRNIQIAELNALNAALESTEF